MKQVIGFYVLGSEFWVCSEFLVAGFLVAGFLVAGFLVAEFLDRYGSCEQPVHGCAALPGSGMLAACAES